MYLTPLFQLLRANHRILFVFQNKKSKNFNFYIIKDKFGSGYPYAIFQCFISKFCTQKTIQIENYDSRKNNMRNYVLLI